MSSDKRAYDLAWVEPGWIAARGPYDAIQGLRRWPGSLTRGGGSYVLLPESRLAFMAAEAMCPVNSLSPSYLAARRRAMAVSLQDLADVDQLLNYPSSLIEDLLPHQLEFCAKAMPLRGALNASEQGTGKTRMAWAMAHLWSAERILIACPASLVRQWEDELDTLWGHGAAPWIALPLGEGTLEARERLLQSYCPILGAVAVIVNYEMLDKLRFALCGELDPDLVVYDESWRLKGKKAAVVRVATELADRAGHVLELAGTPIGQCAADLYSQLRILGEDVVAGYDWDGFASRFCRMEPCRIAGRSTRRPRGLADPAGLMTLLEPVWYRATKATCLQLPPQRDEVVTLQLTPATRALYREVAVNGEAALGCDLSLAGQNVVDLRLAQLTGGHRPTPRGEGAAATWDLAPMLDCPKLAWLREFYSAHLEGDRSVRLLVWCHYTHEADRVARAFRELMPPPQVALVHGKLKTDGQALKDVKDSFNSRAEDGVRVIACTLDKLAFGHNLQAADHNVYFSLPWAHITHAQSRDRSHRMGRVGEVAYHYLLCEDTIDQEIYRALQAHADLTRQAAPDTVGAPLSVV